MLGIRVRVRVMSPSFVLAWCCVVPSNMLSNTVMLVYVWCISHERENGTEMGHIWDEG